MLIPCAKMLLVGLAFTAPVLGADSDRRYTFSWPITSDPALSPRGGTTRGPDMQLDTQTNAAWLALQQPDLTPVERDRRAILAMAGGYRVTFDFLEIADFRSGEKRERPYQSWGTEYVYVAEDRGTFISLQHILVMQVIDRDGKLTPPFVTKHWRQDWAYEDAALVEYVAPNTWARRHVDPQTVRGAWTQAVHQVDDSPRYESTGRWQHSAGMSTWISGETSRPLPRREWSVRKDYNVLVGTNRHTIVPGGWLQEENNLKAVWKPEGGLDPKLPYVGREYGVARYERVRDYDFSAGDDYFRKTHGFWAAVRGAWERRFAASRRITLKAPVDEANLFVPLFERAESFATTETLRTPTAADLAFIESTIEAMIAAR